MRDEGAVDTDPTPELHRSGVGVTGVQEHKRLAKW